jgi:DNA-binding NtrC family response regulator
MILLITPSAKVQECAKVLQEATAEVVQVASTLRQATGQLRAQEYSAVVMDQSLVETEPDDSELVLQHIGTAIPVYINFAISSVDRLVKELRAALHRRSVELVIARQAAEQALRNELKGTATALLLSCELALQAHDLVAAEGKIRQVYELTLELRNKLGIAADDRAMKAAN